MAGGEKPGRAAGWMSVLFVGFLALYPLRRIWLGVDLWDGGYNYANFRYAGTQYMDSMWYFATWIANGVGSLLMKLPFGNTMRGMNLYTGLTVSLLATAGFLFCTKKLKLPQWLAFLAELTACNLCWNPTAALYNYLTFALLLFGCIFLELGLTRDRNGYLAAAGVCLGLNVGVRFSNLVQAALILAVWSYGRMTKKSLGKVIRQTLVCMAGYGAALGAFLALMAAKYGLDTYGAGIARLFAMTETARDYSPVRMLTGVGQVYLDASYWIKRFALALAAMLAVCLPAPGKAAGAKKLFSVAVTLALFALLITHGFFYPDFHTYQSIYDPCVMLLLTAMAVSCLMLLKGDVSKEDKLLAVMELSLVLLTSLGGNNAVFYCINNMFLILPLHIYMLWKLWTQHRGEALFPVKAMASALAVLVCVLALRFGNTFIYEEAGGARNPDTVISEIPVLRGMRTGGERAKALTGLYGYLQESGLSDRTCILYGQIPGIAYYMEMTPAMNVWSDLDSYLYEVMRGDLKRVFDGTEAGREPVLILEHSWAACLAGTEEPNAAWTDPALAKGALLAEYMEKYGYRDTYDNGKYVVYVCGETNDGR